MRASAAVASSAGAGPRTACEKQRPAHRRRSAPPRQARPRRPHRPRDRPRPSGPSAVKAVGASSAVRAVRISSRAVAATGAVGWSVWSSVADEASGAASATGAAAAFFVARLRGVRAAPSPTALVARLRAVFFAGGASSAAPGLAGAPSHRSARTRRRGLGGVGLVGDRRRLGGHRRCRARRRLTLVGLGGDRGRTGLSRRGAATAASGWGAAAAQRSDRSRTVPRGCRSCRARCRASGLLQVRKRTSCQSRRRWGLRRGKPVASMARRRISRGQAGRCAAARRGEDGTRSIRELSPRGAGSHRVEVRAHLSRSHCPTPARLFPPRGSLASPRVSQGRGDGAGGLLQGALDESGQQRRMGRPPVGFHLGQCSQ